MCKRGCRHVCDFIDADFFRWGGIATLFLKLTPSTNANIFPCYYYYYAHFGKNISTANDSTFTAGTTVNRNLIAAIIIAPRPRFHWDGTQR